MMRRLLAFGLFGLAASSLGCDDTILDPMMNDQKYKPYEANEFFADMRAMRTPPAGAVPRERTIGSVQLMTGREAMVEPVPGVPLPPFVKSFPLPVTPELVAEGRKRFEITCATCHGLLGDGDSIVAGKMSLKRPPSLHLRDEPGYYFEILNKGHGIMANYSAELSLEQRWAVVAYIKALQLSQKVPASELPPPMRALLDKGRS